MHETLLARLRKSSFRARFHLGTKERQMVFDKGMGVIQRHAEDLIAKRLAPANPTNDGHQTPMKGHPVFIAQHATGTCCRGCLEKWHRIPRGKELSSYEQQYIVSVLLAWIQEELKRNEVVCQQRK